MTRLGRYSWMIILTIIGMISLIVFFYFIFRDMKQIQARKRSKMYYLLDLSLLIVVVVFVVLAVYLFFDIQNQIRILEEIL